MSIQELRTVTTQFVTFLYVGGIATFAQYVVLLSLAGIAGVNPVLASTLGYAAGAVISYYLNYRYTFRSNTQHLASLPKFGIVVGIGLLLNSAIVAMAIDILRLHWLFSQVIATGTVLVWNFVANKLWTFR